MGVLAFFFAAALLTVGEREAVLREGCEAGDAEVGRLAAGTPVEIRFAINGCYAVRAGERSGYLPASALAGLEDWEAERRGASAVERPGMAGRPESLVPARPVRAGQDPIATASQLLVDQRANEALTLLERALGADGQDAGLLAMAGLAALRAGETTRAIGYLKDSLERRPNPSVRLLLGKAEREASTEQGVQRLDSPRFSLRYDPKALPVEAARVASATLEQEYRRISFELGCRSEERIAAVVQSPEAYRRATEAAEWSGGQFDGRIRVAVLGPVDTVRKTLSHEVAHACLAATGKWPAWLHEGLAQRLSGDQLPPAVRDRVRLAARSGKLPKLDAMGQSWSRMSAEHAAMAYAAALYAVELFYTHHAAYGIRNLLQNPEQLGRVTADLDRRMRE